MLTESSLYTIPVHTDKRWNFMITDIDTGNVLLSGETNYHEAFDLASVCVEAVASTATGHVILEHELDGIPGLCLIPVPLLRRCTVDMDVAFPYSSKPSITTDQLSKLVVK